MPAEPISPPPWPPALALIVDLLSGAGAAAPELTEAEWRDFARLAAERHRVAPMILRAVSGRGLAPPGEVATALAAAARADAAAALAQKAETHRVLSALAAAGCRAWVLKGWPLAEALYGSAALRHAKDLDLYIAPGEIDACLAALGDLGYAIDDEHRARRALLDRPAFRAEFNDLALFDRERFVQLELHWRSYHFRGWPELRDIPGAGANWPLDRTGLRVLVPSPTANLIYLALHGQQHLWQRLKWLLDIARIVAIRGESGLLADLAVARRIGAARPVIVAGHLAHGVLGCPLPGLWPAPDRAARRALARFRRSIASDLPAPGTAATRLRYYWNSLALAESLGQRAGVLRYGLWRRLRFGPVA